MTGLFEYYVIKTLIPVAFLVIGVVLGRNVQRLDDRSYSAVCLLAIAPFWFFRHSLSQIPFTYDFIFILFFILFHTAALFLIAYKFFHILELSPRIHRLFLLNTVAVNILALRQIQPLLGDPAQASQTVNTIIFYYMVIFAVFGAYLIVDERSHYRGLGNILKTPLLYALAAGLTLAVAKIEVPYKALEAIDPLYNIAIPLALIAAGILVGKYVFFVQFQEYGVLIPGLITVLSFRLILSPLLALLIAPLVLMDNIELQRAMILTSGAPTSLLACVLVSYNGKQNEKRFVVLCFLFSALIHFLTLPLLHFLLNSWIPTPD
ncbi:MAG: hypothetical protein JXR73_01600 [Candidatus Omnitrophica bacterium]|nr:hypothetical protein [Candidatus Omnitrophota bacterium]